MGTRITFGPNQSPPAASGPGAGFSTFGDRPDGMLVEENLGNVAHELATKGAGEWPCFNQVIQETTRQVYINPASVRFIAEES